MGRDERDHEFFLRLDGIPGGSAAKDRSGWMDVVAVDWGVEQAVAVSGAGGGMTGVGAKQRALRFVIVSGVASPLLFEACMNGKPLSEGVFEVQRGKSVAVRWVFEDMLVTSFSSETSDGDDGMRDTITLLARRLRYTTDDTRGWDFQSKKPW
ncbi:type VI secretion system tube protein Hcp [Mycobacterium sp. B14F4]|uniref:type VI secretion system tube protein Hcp n=1 Tax=Mycobacterium sp. B14F4 TaxID=3153565 RepID=UPI00325C808F